MTAQANDIQWYIARDGKQHGPLTDIEMRTFVAHSYLRLSDLVWRPGMPEWQPAPNVYPTAFEALGQEPRQPNHYRPVKEDRIGGFSLEETFAWLRRKSDTAKVAEPTFSAASGQAKEPKREAAAKREEKKVEVTSAETGVPAGGDSGVVDLMLSRAKKRAEASAAEATSTNNAPSPQVETERIRLDGRAMRGSTFLTGVGLVVLSWIGLLWCFALSVPLGLGLVGFTAVLSGFFIVPAWGTVFGWLGLGGAKRSTLKQMGFEAVPAGHFLEELTVRFAKELDLRPPNVGTVSVVNAFAMGTHRDDATIAVGQPLLKMMSQEEVCAIVGHEIGHVANGDMMRMMFMRTFQNAVVWYIPTQGGKQFVRWMVSWMSELMILGHSRKREFYADAVGAALAGKSAMISALRALEGAPPITGIERTHSRFMARGVRGFAEVFSTHPSFAARVSALESEKYLRRLPRKR